MDISLIALATVLTNPVLAEPYQTSSSEDLQDRDEVLVSVCNSWP